MTIFGIEYESIKETSVTGRYVHLGHIESWLEKNLDKLTPENLGSSVEGRPIYGSTIGEGPLRILIWSQMHGNEGTTTKSVLDLINLLLIQSDLTSEILRKATIMFIPILNPDGAIAYTRENARGKDLNRDAQKKSQPETRILHKVYNEFKPEFCLNLHGQRSIYSAGHTNNSATISFLAPAADKGIGLTPSRIFSMKLIAAMQKGIEPVLGECVGRYDDSYNLNCIGDTFQSQGTPTVLFEAGHYPGDYEREETRKFVWHTLVHGIVCLIRDELDQYTIEQYTSIPNNEKLFFDILIRNVSFLNSKFKPEQSIGIHYDEIKENDKVIFSPKIELIGFLDEKFGHQEYDCKDPNDVQTLKTDPELKSLLF